MLYVVIPVHNRLEITRKCLISLTEQVNSNFEVVVVDDGSTDGTSAMIEREFPDVVLLHGDGTLWWAGATNMGCRYALDSGAELMLTLNDDVIVKSDYVEKMISAHRHCQNAIIGSMNLSQEHPPRLFYAGVESYNFWTAKTIKRGKIGQIYENQFTGLLPTLYLPGRGTLIPKSIFKAIGFFDDKTFKHYAADDDFTLRAKKANFQILINCDTAVYSPYETKRAGGIEQNYFVFLRSFFQFKSSNYLPATTCWSYRHCPHKWFFPMNFFLENMRRVSGFIGNKRRIDR